MTTQQILLSVLIFSAMNNIASAMDNATTKNYSEEEKIFHANVSQLKHHAASFVLQFEDWSKEEQDKITIYNSDAYRDYVVSGKPKQSQLFDNNVGLYLDHHVTKKELIPFLNAMEYLKKQKTITTTNNSMPKHIDNSTNNNNNNNNDDLEKEIFKMNRKQLNDHAKAFVDDFKDWTKTEQDKLKIYNSNVCHTYMVTGKLRASKEYGGNIVAYLDAHVPKKELIPFLEAMEYLKKQK